ncbi:MAG: hypothetical protein QXJ74_03785 [Nitrososphaera sp.]|uniref:hypothetical protein n=1 Tax=Nitrososphaera sp. TaxID=1971748 RepID=UPI001852EE71|nr:hypothetical protein [Nitrososphaera sp.]NWG36917.1 hypothetical protein [Nitrososphaera sp.]
MDWLPAMQILPEGSVRNEGVFFVLVAGLAILVGIAMYLRHKRNKQPDWPTE